MAVVSDKPRRPPVFIFGMGRSGTTFTRQLVCWHLDLSYADVWFEPHELWFAVSMQRFPRYMDGRNPPVADFSTSVLEDFRTNASGFKFALIPSQDCMEWPRFEEVFGDLNPIYLIVERDVRAVYKSATRRDEASVRGAVAYEQFAWWHTHIYDSFRRWQAKEPDRVAWINYEDYHNNQERALADAGRVLGKPFDPAWLAKKVKPPQFKDGLK